MNDRIYAPFTPEQVRNLNVYQRSGMYHPFTCGNRSDHPEDEIYKGCLVATVHGWICPICWDGTKEDMQNWAVPFMAIWASKLEMEKAQGYRTVSTKEPIDKKMEWLHTFCHNNRERLASAGYGHCFYCSAMDFPVDSIREWVGTNNQTALCPDCSIDTVLPKVVRYSSEDELEDYFITNKDLLKMRKYWF
jgi:hypothetical protein